MLSPQIHGIVSSGKGAAILPPLVHLEEAGLQGDNTWLNTGTGGSIYDYTTVNNTADFSQPSVNGVTVLQNDNNGYLVAPNYPAEQTPGQSYTVIRTLVETGASKAVFAKQSTIEFIIGEGTSWRARLGNSATVSPVGSIIKTVIVVIDWINTTDFTIEVVGEGTSTATGASTNVDFTSLFARPDGLLPYNGLIGEHLYYDSILDAPDRANVIAYLQDRFGL